MSQDTPSNHPYRLDLGAWRSGSILPGCLGWAVIIFSPFIGFAIHGTVGEEGLTFAIFPFIVGCVLVVSSSFRTWRDWRKLPKEVRKQPNRGKLFPPLAIPEARAGELTYHVAKNNKGEVLLSEKGVAISQKALHQASWGLMKEVAAGLSAAQATPVDYIHQVEWSALAEWQVKDNSDGLDYYTLCYRDKRSISILRPFDRALEPRVLDYVRSVGQCPVRLFVNAGT